MKQKINMRLSLIALIAIIMTAIGLTLVYYNLFQVQVRDDLKQSARILVETEVFQKAYTSGKEDAESLDKLSSGSLRITWIDEDGTVLYDNDTDIEELANHMDRPEIRQAFETGEIQEKLFDRKTGIESELLRQISQSAAEVPSHRRDLPAVEQNAAFGGLQKIGHDPHEGGFSRPVRSEKPVDSAFERKTHAGQGFGIPVPFAYILKYKPHNSLRSFLRHIDRTKNPAVSRTYHMIQKTGRVSIHVPRSSSVKNP